MGLFLKITKNFSYIYQLDYFKLLLNYNLFQVLPDFLILVTPIIELL